MAQSPVMVISSQSFKFTFHGLAKFSKPLTSACGHTFASNWQLSLSNQQKRESGEWNDFLINLHKINWSRCDLNLWLLILNSESLSTTFGIGQSVVGTQQKQLTRALSMTTHNVMFLWRNQNKTCRQTGQLAWYCTLCFWKILCDHDFDMNWGWGWHCAKFWTKMYHQTKNESNRW